MLFSILVASQKCFANIQNSYNGKKETHIDIITHFTYLPKRKCKNTSKDNIIDNII